MVNVGDAVYSTPPSKHAVKKAKSEDGFDNTIYSISPDLLHKSDPKSSPTPAGKKIVLSSSQDAFQRMTEAGRKETAWKATKKVTTNKATKKKASKELLVGQQKIKWYLKPEKKGGKTNERGSESKSETANEPQPPLLPLLYPRGTRAYYEWLRDQVKELGVLVDSVALSPPPPFPPPPPPPPPLPLRRGDYFLSRCFHTCLVWLGVIPRLGLLRRVRSAGGLLFLAVAILAAVFNNLRYQPEYETTLNPSVTTKMMLRNPPVGFYNPNDTRLLDTLSP
ncbi:hypothetical protein F5Y19DRAFT_491132 [Xylariaceae sp. FL1651]|nr:hypothetical protein F5Y19DRAFT_491132 [Xylariaceae sp. FL1651]